MTTIKAFFHFIAQYYERILAVVVMLILVIFSGVLVMRVSKLNTEITQRERTSVKKSAAKAHDLTELNSSLALVDAPPSWSSNSPGNNHLMFIAPYMKVLDSENPFPQIIPRDQITDFMTAEGLSSKWLNRYGLPVKGKIANTDPDGDGFSVREEYDALTDPTDPDSAPDLASKLRVEKITQKPFPFIFNGVAEGQGGIKFSILRRDGKKNYYCKLDEVIPDTDYKGFRLLKYEIKTILVPDKSIRGPDGKPIVNTVDVSELTVQKEGGNPVILVKSKQVTADDWFARLYYVLETRSLDVAVDSKFTLQDNQYQVVSIKKLDDGKPEVIIKRLDPAGKESPPFPPISPLKPEDLKPIIRTPRRPKTDMKPKGPGQQQPPPEVPGRRPGGPPGGFPIPGGRR